LTKKEEIAWAAGFFEGEGCFFASFQKPRQNGTRIFRTHASLAQKDVSLLEKFKEIVGFGIICNNSKDVKAWKTSKVGEAEQLLEIFRPWLSNRRLETAKSLLQKEKEQILRPLPQCCPNGHEYTEANTIYFGNKRGRGCKTCRNEYAKQWRSRQPKDYWKKYV
jgi:hypothetical protein